MRWRLVATAIGALGLGSVIAYGQSVGPNSLSQFNTSGAFGGIAGVTSDGANVGFATSSHLYIYGFGSGNCLKSGAGGQIADAGSPCGGSGSPGGVNTQVQFNTFGAFGGITGATSNGSNISFTTNSLVINGQAISNVSGTTGTLATVSGSLASNCVKADGSGNLVNSGSACGGTSATNIAAGTNITTSGTTANVTVNVVATPSFTTVIASGNITAGTAQFTGQLTGTSAVFQTATVNNLTPTGPNCLQETSGVLQATNTPCATQTATPSIAAGSNITTSGTAANTTINVVATPSFTTVIASGNITAGTAQFTGQVTGTSAVFQTVTVNNLTPTGPNCLQETSGVLQATNVPCAASTATVSIAAGNNITTSGTASNITVNATPTGANSSVQFNNAGVFGGDSGFQYAGGSSGIVTHTLGNVTTTNARALSIIGTLSSSIVVFDAPLFANITTNAFAVGSKLVDIQATTISVFGVSPSGSINSGALQSAATQCLQASAGGLIFGTAVPCATQTSTPSIAAGTNITTSGTAANTTVNMVPTTPEFGLQYNHAGLLTADTGFTYGSSPGIATLTLGPGNLTTTNSRAFSIIGTISSGTVQFNPPFFMNITTNAFASGTKLVDIQASGISYLTVFASTGMTVLGNLTSTQQQITGWLTGPGANLQTATIAGALIGSTGNFSSNLTASTIMGVVGWLTAPGTNLQTATIASNLTGSTIVGIVGWLTAPGVNMQTATLAGALNGVTGNFTSNLTGQIGAFPGFLTATGTNFFTSTISQLTATSAWATNIIGNAGTNSEGSISFLTNNVIQLGDGGANTNGWYNWRGEARLSADSAGLITTGFGNILSVSVNAGRTYKFDAELPLKSATASTGGIGLRIGGGATVTNIVYDGWVVDSGFNGTKGNTQATALSTTVASTSITGTTSHATLIGTVTVNAAGTIILQASGFSTVTAASAVTVARGATFILEDMP